MQIIHTSVSLAIMHKIIKFCTLSHVAVSSDNIENHFVTIWLCTVIPLYCKYKIDKTDHD